MVADAAEAERFPKRAEIKQMAAETQAGVRAGIERMDQTDEDEALVRILVRMIEEKRLHVRVYTKGRLHAKRRTFLIMERSMTATARPWNAMKRGSADP